MGAISVLIVDDEIKFAELLASRLSNEGWTIRTAGSGNEALKILQEQAVDILASDFRMLRGMNGAELVNQALAFKPDLYSIILTAWHERDYVLQSLEAGVAAFLEKSPRIDGDLTAAIRRGIQTITLTRIGRRLLDLQREEEVLDLIIESLGRLKEFDSCCLADRVGQNLYRVERAVDFRTGQEIGRQQIDDPDSAYRYVIEEQRAYLPAFFGPEGRILHPFVPESKSIAVVPLVLRGGIRGALGIEHREGNRLGIEDLRFLNQIAYWVSLAMGKITQQDERVQMEEERARERRDLLARAALHEIKNPLNNLATAVQVASAELLPETQKTLLENISRINNALNKILRPLIRGEDSPRETIDLDPVIQEAVSRFRLYHPDGVTRLTVTVSPALPTIIGYRAMLVSAIVNLLENAATATKSSGRSPEVRVTADYVPVRDQVEVVVNDNGSGIPAHLVDRVFDYGVTSQLERGNTGYGLAFAKDVVSLCGGYIAVSSTEGEGTTFKLSFPVGMPAEHSAEGR
ncbi:MAG TPA: ATP-binding protein [Thermoanaerobaculia bacterium]|nr:ATP-binding protein [Thermoanaerobaculia bacterium]